MKKRTYKEKYCEQKIERIKDSRILPASFFLAGVLFPLLIITKGYKPAYVTTGIVLMLLGYLSLREKQREIRRLKDEKNRNIQG